MTTDDLSTDALGYGLAAVAYTALIFGVPWVIAVLTAPEARARRRARRARARTVSPAGVASLRSGQWL